MLLRGPHTLSVSCTSRRSSTQHVLCDALVCFLQDTEVLELEQHAAYRQELNELQAKTEDAADRDRQATARAEAAAFAAANKAAAAAYKQQADAEAEVAALRAQKRAEALAAVPPAPADLFKFDLSVLDSEVPGSDQLMEVLLGFRQDMLEGLYGVTSTMQVSLVGRQDVWLCKGRAGLGWNQDGVPGEGQSGVEAAWWCKGRVPVGPSNGL